MIYNELLYNISWSSKGSLNFNAFHVTPYLKEILDSGKLLPPTKTQKFVLGENAYREDGDTVRGCLLSFFDEFQSAMNACYSLAMFAILEKKLLSWEEFLPLVEAEIVREASSNNEHMEEIEFDIKDLKAIFLEGHTSEIFGYLGDTLERFTNPYIMGNQWVQDLPNSIDGILSSIGVIEVSFKKTFISDPSLLEVGFHSPIYGYTDTKGNFGEDIGYIQAIYSSRWEGMSHDEKCIHTAQAAAQTAIFVNSICHQEHCVLANDDLEILLESLFYDLDEFEKVESAEFGTCFVFEDEVTFVTKVTIDPLDLALWNPMEHEWRIPCPNGIPISESNVVALASEVSIAIGNTTTNKIENLFYKEGSAIRGRRKNPYLFLP